MAAAIALQTPVLRTSLLQDQILYDDDTACAFALASDLLRLDRPYIEHSQCAAPAVALHLRLPGHGGRIGAAEAVVLLCAMVMGTPTAFRRHRHSNP